MGEAGYQARDEVREQPWAVAGSLNRQRR
jgi:hypothetical protein